MISTNLVFGIVLAGALLHATWNGLIKGSNDTLLSAVGITTAAALMGVVVLPWLPQPAPASWPFVLASVVLQLVYMALVARIYRVADMGATYPIMRGTAPLLVTVVSVALLNDSLDTGAIVGIAILCGGILCMGRAAAGNAESIAGLRLALMNACVIAGYTLVDGSGARLSGAPVAYTLWIFALQGAGMLCLGALLRGGEVLGYLGTHWKASLAGGFGSIASYGTALWAMTLAPIAVIAALRETSILFGVLLSALVLREHVGLTRVVGACILVAGAIVLRLA